MAEVKVVRTTATLWLPTIEHGDYAFTYFFIADYYSTIITITKNLKYLVSTDTQTGKGKTKR